MRPENRALLGPDDIILATHPGSGASWISTLLVHLGVFYASGHNELLLDRSSQRTGGWIDDEERDLPRVSGEGANAPVAPLAVRFRDQRQHLPTLASRDQLHPSYREACRVIKTNQASVGWEPENRVLLLVRDGRDAVLSLYHNLRSFSSLDVSLQAYLSGNQRAWLPPAMSWGVSCMSWSGTTAPQRLHILKFEACREDPLTEFRAMLRFLGVDREDVEIERAIAESSYKRMRDVETGVMERQGPGKDRGRVMRKGKVGEWRDVFTPEMLETFKGLPRRALESFGYPTDSIPD